MIEVSYMTLLNEKRNTRFCLIIVFFIYNNLLYFNESLLKNNLVPRNPPLYENGNFKNKGKKN